MHVCVCIVCVCIHRNNCGSMPKQTNHPVLIDTYDARMIVLQSIQAWVCTCVCANKCLEADVLVRECRYMAQAYMWALNYGGARPLCVQQPADYISPHEESGGFSLRCELVAVTQRMRKCAGLGPGDT